MSEPEQTGPAANPLADAVAAAPVAVQPQPLDPLGDEPKDKGSGPDTGLPEGCPVTALGVDGITYVYLSGNGQLVHLPANKFAASMLDGLFGRYIYQMVEMWPKWRMNRETGEYETTGDADYARLRKALMTAASAKGIWSGYDRTRGVGSWVGPEEQLIVHQGDRVWVGPPPDEPAKVGKYHQPGLIGRHVYPAGPVQPRPSGIVDGVSPVPELLRLLEAWNWRRGAVDARLMLGWLGVAMMGGALEWRPSIWVTGSTGTGKSTLQKKVLRPLLDDGVVGDADTTAAAIRSQVGASSLPIMLDEKEPGEIDHRLQDMIRIMRYAASGERSSRGSADHSLHESRLVSAVMFASTLVPPLEPQDLNRLAFLELDPLQDRREPEFDRRRMREIGGYLRRQLMQRWPEWPARVGWWQEAMRGAGHEARGASVYGTLLAAADLLLGEPIPESRAAVEPLLDELSADRIADQRGDEADEDQCLAHLLSARIEWARGTFSDVGSLVVAALDEMDGAPQRRAMEQFGLKLILATRGEGAQLCIANKHRELDRYVYQQSKWQRGVWTQSLRRLPGAEKSVKPQRFGQVTARCTVLAVDRHVLGLAAPSDPTGPAEQERN